MAHPYHHALSSVKKWGGTVEDYLAIRGWFDESKKIIADFRHRALRHHAEGIFMAVIWTGKRHSNLVPTEMIVPVVHRRGLAVRVARIDAQAERAARRYLWTHRGDDGLFCLPGICSKKRLVLAHLNPHSTDGVAFLRARSRNLV